MNSVFISKNIFLLRHTRFRKIRLYTILYAMSLPEKEATLRYMKKKETKDRWIFE